MNRLSGYNSAAVLVKEVMEYLHRDDLDGLKDLSFPVPETHTALRICPVTGKLASTFSQIGVMEYFDEASRPVEVSHFMESDFPDLVEGFTIIRNPSSETIRIRYPEDNLCIIRDPETPEEMNTLELAADAGPETHTAIWYRDGVPFQTSYPPHAVRWSLEPGTHSFQVCSVAGDVKSNVVRVVVI